MTEQTRKAEYWTTNRDEERLSATCILEALEMWADKLEGSPLPETVTVYGFAPRALPSEERMAETVWEHLIEWLDEEYGDPDEWTTPSEALKEAARVFARVVEAEYRVWSCDLVETCEVSVAEYLP